MSENRNSVYEFGPFRLDTSQELLLEGTRKILLTPKAYQTLLVMVENHGRIVTKGELLQKVWPDAYVEEATLAQNVFTLRKQLCDDREGALYIETVPKRGYRFVAEVRQVDTAPTAPVAEQPTSARHKIVYGVVLACVIGGILAGWYWTSLRRTSGLQVAESRPNLRTLAVLPFRELSENAAEESWGIGMTDAIITRLTTLQNLAVRPTASVLKYSKSPVDPTRAAQELGVESVLDGTYQRVGDTIRVSVQLIEPKHQATRWAERYDLGTKDLLNFEDEVAQKVVEGLRVEVSGRERDLLASMPTTSSEAYSLYLQGRVYKNQYFIRTQLDSLRRGEAALHQAVAADPSFDDGYALLGLLYVYQSANFLDNAAGNLAQGEQAARRAIELNPNSVEGLVALGFALTESGRNEDAIPKLRQAIALAPNSELAWDLLGYVYHYAGLDEFAEKAYRRSLELDPNTPRIYWMHSRMLLYIGKVREAEQEMRQALGMHPEQFKVMTYLGKFLYYQGRLDEAEPILQRAVELGSNSGSVDPGLMSAFLYASRGQRNKIDPAIFRERPQSIIDGDQAYWFGGVYALLGEKAQAIAWLRRAVELGNHNYSWFARDKNYDKLRGDPDYERILADVRSRADKYRQEFGASSF
ncbi:MAG TPA: winged helix-turn-helix domain-containing protein [Blastocatellia bacterium]|nr:winged helix-turn-helix domain-containing protein [Blastocatellia bacterium]